ncbi:MAG: HAD family hydrolase [Paracoccaceae bacterium]
MPALLFDLDGTLLSSDPLHVRVFVQMFAERGRTIDADYYFAHMHGRHNSAIFGDHFPGEDAEALSVEKEARFRVLLGGRADPMPGARALITRAQAAGWGLAVVTNAPRINAEAMLQAIGLASDLPHLIIGDECSAGKPDPAPYLAALDRLGMSARDALAFEDSPSGLMAARAADLRVIGLRSSLDDTALRTAGAHITIFDYTDPALATELARLTGA